MIEFYAYALLFLMVTYVILGFDDALIDWMFWWRGLGPQVLNRADQETMQSEPQKRIAVMIAGWQEDDVLEHMIKGNSASIEYQNYTFFLGVYPNDSATWTVARGLETRFANVVVIVNEKNGPTSKGQMLNQMVRDILKFENASGQKYDVFAIHDAEDVIHRKSFQVINRLATDNDFIQIPIFSLPLSKWSLVGGTYVDEFAEIHTKDILVRESMGAKIPSAGVGTFMSHRLVSHMIQKYGRLLNPASVTEDYELGVGLEGTSFRSTFGYYLLESEKGREFVATREYFPKIFWRSVRQKTRWTLGISFQGARNLGWKGRLVHKYFLFRDRKGPVANVLVLFGLFLFLVGGLWSSVVWNSIDQSLWENTLNTLHDKGLAVSSVVCIFTLAFIFMANRVGQRFICTARVYGYGLAALVPVRILVANLVNSFASLRATKEFLVSEITGKAPKWAKTAHELPPSFGMESLTMAASRTPEMDGTQTR